MSYIFGDTFDLYSGAYWDNFSYHWTSGGIETIGTGRYGGYYVRLYANSRKSLGANYSTLIVSMAIKWPTSGTTYYLPSPDDDGNLQVKLNIDTTGKLKLYRGNETTLLATSTNSLNTGQWYWLSWKTVFGASGTSEARINGSSTGWINYSGDTTATANDYANGILTLNGLSAYLDDLIVLDSSGSVFNDFITERKGFVYMPNGAGGYTQWTASAGSNYQCVDENPNNGDTDYVYTNTSTNRDSYTHASVSDFSSIDVTQARAVIRKDDVASHTASLFYRRSSTNYNGTAATVGASYAEIVRIDEVDPATSAAWTMTNLNNTEVGVLLDT